MQMLLKVSIMGNEPSSCTKGTSSKKNYKQVSYSNFEHIFKLVKILNKCIKAILLHKIIDDKL